MNVLMLGSSGFVGRHITAALLKRGDTVTPGSLRDPDAAAKAAAACDAVINLAGEPLAQRWNGRVKERIERSRVDLPRRFLQALGKNRGSVATYVSASAIGYYGTSETKTFVESNPPGDDFLAHVCVEWEREADRARDLHLRVAIVRSGVALGRDGGALAAMLPAFQRGLGGVIGSGRQWLSWIHIDDLVGIYLLALDRAEGELNGTAPNPATNAEFVRELGAALHRPARLPVPVIALRAMLGEGADMLLRGQRVLPQRTHELGYAFRFALLKDALANLL